MKQSSGMGTSPVVIPAATAMLVVALLVAFCFGPTAAGAAAGRPSHTDDDTDATIRLPSSAGAGGRPWECCDWVTQDPIFRPPRWRCNDVVDKCSADCQQCEASASGAGAGGFVCRDWVVSLFEPPVCTPRPWDCCDLATCTRDYIPYCRCSDKVESCPSNCRECELVESSDSDPPRYRCLDVFHGYPGPKCTPWVSKSN